MLRLPAFELREPESVEEAVELLGELGPDAMPIAGGTDLLPNLKHRLFEPRVLVSLARIASMRGIAEERDGSIVIGATSLLPRSRSIAVRRERPRSRRRRRDRRSRLRTRGRSATRCSTRAASGTQTYSGVRRSDSPEEGLPTPRHVVEGGSKPPRRATTRPALMTLCGARPRDASRPAHD
jgi:hypothetical protein